MLQARRGAHGAPARRQRILRREEGRCERDDDEEQDHGKANDRAPALEELPHCTLMRGFTAK
jgi:hypothetical protein